MTSYKDTKLGMLPSTWNVESMNSIVKSTQLGTNSLGKDGIEGVPLIKMGNLTKGSFSFKKVQHILVEEFEGNEGFLLSKGDFLFNTRNTLDLVGKSAVWNDGLSKAIFNNNIMRIKFNEHIDDFYMCYYYENEIGWKELKRIATGTTSVAAIYTKDLMKAKVIVPPLTEQKKIAEILLTVDDHIDEVNAVIKDLKELKKGLMKKLLTEGIEHQEFKDSVVGRIPMSWKVVEQSDVSNFYNGRAYKRSEFKTEGTPIIRIQNLTGTTKYVYSDLELEDNKYVEAGDLIYAWSATFGPFIWKREKGIYHYHIWKIECKDNLDKMFYYYRLNYISDELGSHKNGSAFAHITKGFMEKHKIALPPIMEQRKIAEILGSIDERIDLYQNESAEVSKLKIGLMQQLFTGNSRVKL